MAIQDFSNRFQVAEVYSVDELLAKVVQRIDIRLELAPAWKTVAARDQELRFGKPQCRTVCTHGFEALFCFVS